MPQVRVFWISYVAVKGKQWFGARNDIRSSPFFLCLASSDRLRFSRFQKKKSYTEGNEGNDTLFQRIVTLIWNISNFLPYRFLVFPCSRLILTTTSTFSFLHCRDVDFVTTPCCFQAPRILCWGTGPPSSRLLFQFYFCCFFPFPTDPKSENAFDNKQKKGGGMAYLSGISCMLQVL